MKERKMDYSVFRDYKPSKKMRELGQAFADALNAGAMKEENGEPSGKCQESRRKPR